MSWYTQGPHAGETMAFSNGWLDPVDFGLGQMPPQAPFRAGEGLGATSSATNKLVLIGLIGVIGYFGYRLLTENVETVAKRAAADDRKVGQIHEASAEEAFEFYQEKYDWPESDWKTFRRAYLGA